MAAPSQLLVHVQRLEGVPLDDFLLKAIHEFFTFDHFVLAVTDLNIGLISLLLRLLFDHLLDQRVYEVDLLKISFKVLTYLRHTGPQLGDELIFILGRCVSVHVIPTFINQIEGVFGLLEPLPQPRVVLSQEGRGIYHILIEKFGVQLLQENLYLSQGLERAVDSQSEFSDFFNDLLSVRNFHLVL